jgi:hypothetical protein
MGEDSIVNDFPTRRGSCGMYFHDLNSGGIAVSCNLTVGHTGPCSNNPSFNSQRTSEMNDHFDNYMRTRLPDHYGGGKKDDDDFLKKITGDK